MKTFDHRNGAVRIPGTPVAEPYIGGSSSRGRSPLTPIARADAPPPANIAASDKLVAAADAAGAQRGLWRLPVGDPITHIPPAAAAKLRRLRAADQAANAVL